MELYTKASYQLSEILTKRYSTSFSLSSRLFSKKTRKHIYAVYGLVRIADEIVDTYRQSDSLQKLNVLETQVYESIKSQYSTNPIVHSFALTAKEYSINRDLISPFFESMRVDITKKSFNLEEYKRYIYGSAEVVGLMCLRIFVDGNEPNYKKLKKGASALGSAYQKVNFLRDIKDDHTTLGRVYFPGLKFKTLSEQDKQAILEDIAADFDVARSYIKKLPRSSRAAVRASYYYYTALLRRLQKTPVSEIKIRRIRISNTYKLLLLARAALRR